MQRRRPGLVLATFVSMLPAGRAVSADSEAALSPTVNPDHTITLRLRAADAARVTASGDVGALTLTRGAQGVWSATSAPLEPAIYRYFFTVDGVQMADPGNPDRKSNTESLLTVPGSPPMPWEVRNVPHGKVAPVLYRSRVFEAQRRLFVYTPPGYEAKADRLPVLYLLHGYTDDDSAWTAVGKANLIADSLIADGRMAPLIIVMPYGQLNDSVPPQVAFSDSFERRFEREILEEIVPSIEKEYRVVPDARHRAMAGISMGGMQAAFIGMNHPDLFSCAGMWSPAFFGDPAALFSRLAGSPAELRSSFAYVHLAVGQQDDLDLLPRSEAIHAFLTSAGIGHSYTPVPGTHSWVLWRGWLVDFLVQYSKKASSKG
jgi:enterochelin esterase-like enzyme